MKSGYIAYFSNYATSKDRTDAVNGLKTVSYTHLIYQEGDLAVTGRELDAMSEKELQEKLEKICVYARVSPEIGRAHV